MADSDNDSGGGENNGSNNKEENRLLPLANVSRIMKIALPANAKIPKEAKEMVQECASEFISFITSGASDKCLREKRKTINGDDLLWAMSTLGFDDYIDPLKLYLHKFRELEGDKQGIGSGAPGDGGSASSPLSQPTDVLGGGGNVGGSYGAGLYGTGIGGAGSGGSGMINMVLMDQQLYGGAPGGGGSASSSISSQPTDVLGGGGNVGGSYGAGLYGTGTGGAGSDGSGMMVMGQELYGGSPMSGSLYQHQQHQLGSGLFPGNSGSGSGGGSGRSSSPSGRRKDMI
ncbi:nuclear transcription factor Y subunit B-3 [Carex littledalei]|uniref:Nuclear transcription factor Y subunit B-3 n=1 Tax=Carex littledalei TaxID=544730 RepID=A0A833RFI5_9POAL|nr:nuclear transcription factor Y subunit B-3 [Carex littledalei]